MVLRIEIQSEEDEDAEITRFAERLERRERVAPLVDHVARDLEVMRQILTPERIRLLQLIRRHKPPSLYALAKLARRDRKAVVDDVYLLAFHQFVALRRSKRGGRRTVVPSVPYDEIRIGVRLDPPG